MNATYSSVKTASEEERSSRDSFTKCGDLILYKYSSKYIFFGFLLIIGTVWVLAILFESFFTSEVIKCHTFVKESFIDVCFSTTSIYFDIPEAILGRMILIDGMFASSVFIDGEQETVRNMPDRSSDYNMFSFELGVDNDILMLKKIVLDFHSKIPSSEFSTGYLDIFQIEEKRNGKLLVEITKSFEKSFGIVDLPNEDDKEVITLFEKVSGANEVLNLRVSHKIEEDFFESITLNFILLPLKASAMRVTSDKFGYFAVQYFNLGIEEQKSFFKKKDIDAKLQIIHRYDLSKRETINYYVHESIPAFLWDTTREAVEEWNQAFEFAGFKDEIIRAILPSDKEYPKNLDVSDARYSTISWSVDEYEIYAIGSSTVDPRSGEILVANIVLAHGWLKAWFGDLLFDLVESEIENKEGVENELILKMFKAAMKSVVLHEVGHTLGLRHNFKASSVFPFAHINDIDYLKSHDLSSSVMDYLPFHFLDVDNIEMGFMQSVGLYDKLAIAYGYKLLPMKDQLEDPLSIDSENNWFETKYSERIDFSTDEDIEQNDYLGHLFDLTDEPHKYFVQELKRTSTLRDFFNKLTPESTYYIESRILNRIESISNKLVVLLVSKQFPSRFTDLKYQEVGCLKENEVWFILDSLLEIIQEPSSIFDLNLTGKLITPSGDCSGINVYCEGKRLLPLPKVVSSIVSNIINGLLAVETAIDLTYRVDIGASKPTFFLEYFTKIEEALFDGIFDVSIDERNETNIELKVKFMDVARWDQQHLFIDRLSKIAKYPLNLDIFEVPATPLRSYVSVNALVVLNGIEKKIAFLAQQETPEDIKAHAKMLLTLISME